MGRCRVKKKKIRKNDREREREMIPVFFLPSVENDYEHKGCRHTCTYERGVRLPVEKKKGDRAN